MSGVELPWEELHHRSYFLPELDHLENEYFREILSQRVGSPVVPLSSPGPMVDGNMANISSMIPINISCNPGTIENVYIGADCSHAEILEYNELFKEFRDILLGLTMRCQVLTLEWSNMRLRLTPTLILFDNFYAL